MNGPKFQCKLNVQVHLFEEQKKKTKIPYDLITYLWRTNQTRTNYEEQHCSTPSHEVTVQKSKKEGKKDIQPIDDHLARLIDHNMKCEPLIHGQNFARKPRTARLVK